MRHTDKTIDEREPMGIVINNGGRNDTAPLLAAFVWGPVPDDAEPAERVPTRRVAA